MKTLFTSLLALGLCTGVANAKPGSFFDQLRDSAPRSDGVFGTVQDSAPRSPFDRINDTAPRSDGVFGTVQDSAP